MREVWGSLPGTALFHLTCRYSVSTLHVLFHVPFCFPASCSTGISIHFRSARYRFPPFAHSFSIRMRQESCVHLDRPGNFFHNLCSFAHEHPPRKTQCSLNPRAGYVVKSAVGLRFRRPKSSEGNLSATHGAGRRVRLAPALPMNGPSASKNKVSGAGSAGQILTRDYR